MAEYCISCCSTADLSKEHFDRRNIHYICFHFELGGQEYLDDLGQTVPPETMYRRMSEGADTKTSQVSIGEYEEHFEQFLKAGKDVLHLCLSSGISGTYNSACIARDSLQEKYPGRKIYVADSLAASSGFGLLMDTLADKRDAGMDIDTLYAWTQENKNRLQHWFFSTDLTFYIKGGRISKTSGFIGTVLSICPLSQDGLNYAGKCYISQSACLEDAQAVAALVEERFPHLNGKVEIYPIGATIGSHTGPGTVALFFWGVPRVD